MTYTGKWFGKNRYFGLHYDFHAAEKDTNIGTGCTVKNLIENFRLMKPEWVQTDCKGHPGYTSWFSKVPTASVSPGVVKDALACWRAATKKLGLPLICHYSGIWDTAAAKKYPAWRVVPRPNEKPALHPEEKMCPRGPYVDELLIPQMKELIDRYGVDGFWIDGDIWGVVPCYCDKCRAEFAKRTGIAVPPTDESDPNWTAWRTFTRESYYEYVTRYVDAVHAHKPGVLVCSNWLQTFHNPGEPKIPTDWLSGDAPASNGYDRIRVDSRFISTRGKPWDLMLWNFYASRAWDDEPSPWTVKPPEMLMQEAATVLAFGGNLQIYENTSPLRDGRLIPWRMNRMGEVGKFVKRRKALCQETASIPQVAVLHSERHYYSTPNAGGDWMHEVSGTRGAIEAILENSYGVDILDEWALTPRLNDFPIIVASEQDRMSPEMAAALKHYVAGGGRLLVIGAESFDTFGGEFLGVESVSTEGAATYYAPAGDGSSPVWCDSWRMVKPTTAKALGRLGKNSFADADLLPYPYATVNKVGKGMVAYVPFRLGRFFHNQRFPGASSCMGDLLAALKAPLDIRVEAPIAVDVILRRKGKRRIVHLVNRSSGIPNKGNDASVDQIPLVGPITVEMKVDARPAKVTLVFEDADVEWKYVPAAGTGRSKSARAAGGKLVAVISDVRIHSALVVS